MNERENWSTLKDVQEYLGVGRESILQGQNIDYNLLKNIRIPVPPIEEQEQIARYLDSINARINARINEISLLKKYRDSIMSGIVTGETDVRDIEIPEYDFVEEEADSDTEDTNDVKETEEQED